MLDTVTAVRFDMVMTSGRTSPCLLSTQRADGQEIEVIAKFSASCDRSVGSLVVEAIAAMVATDLDLPVPEPFLVEIDAEFAALIPNQEIARRVLASDSAAFGSKKLPPGFSIIPAGTNLPQIQLQSAAEIFAFDALIQNPDRRPEKPNCQFNGKSLAIFDHELALLFENIIGGFKPPWVLGGADIVKWPTPHLFYRELKGKEFDFSRLKGAWAAISDERIAEYRNALPATWLNYRNVASETLSYIAGVRENIGLAIAEIQRVLK